jgi:nucleotide-binding universal stress UspA family protein
MTIRNILVPCFPDVAFENQLAAAVCLAREIEAHISAVFVLADPRTMLAAIPAVSLAAGVDLKAIERDCEAVAAQAEARFEGWRKEQGLPACMVERSLRTPYASWSRRTGAVGPTVVRCGRLADLIILNLPDSSQPATGMAFDAAVFDSGRPTLLIPRSLPSNLLRHVVIAWNGSRQSTRAIAGAMTLLHEAEKVSIFTTLSDEELAEDLDLAEFLSWHGINPRYYWPKAGEYSTGNALLRTASEIDASMLVMGAYTHSRLQQMLLGGVTKQVIENTNLPVLMMH